MKFNVERLINHCLWHNNKTISWPIRDPYENLVNVGYWCLSGHLNKADFSEYVGIYDKFDFYLIGNTRGFKISFVDIKMLLTGKISTENLPNVNTNNKDNVSLTYNGMKIIIQKQ